MNQLILEDLELENRRADAADHLNQIASDDQIDDMLKDSPVHSGRIRTFNPKAFQYRWGVKVSPIDMKMFARKYKLND